MRSFIVGHGLPSILIDSDTQKLSLGDDITLTLSEALTLQNSLTEAIESLGASVSCALAERWGVSWSVINSLTPPDRAHLLDQFNRAAEGEE